MGLCWLTGRSAHAIILGPLALSGFPDGWVVEKIEEMNMKKIAFAVLVIVSALSSMACNTVQGLGKDIERGGQAIEKAAR